MPARADEVRRSGALLLPGAARAPATVVGEIRGIEALDERAWRAVLVVERPLSGDHAAGERVPIAWEELATAEPRRFDGGMRVVVALEPLPGWSIWRQRLAGRPALGIARRGEAWLRDPDAPTTEILSAWLARPPADRVAVAALPELAALLAEAPPPLAVAALDVIAALPGLATRLDGEAGSSLHAVLADPTRPEPLRAGLAALLGARKLEAFRPDLERLSASGSPLAADALAALAALDDGIPRERAEAALARPESEVRAAALRHAREDLPLETVDRIRRNDPDAGVRAAAITVWVRRRGVESFDVVEPLLARPQSQEGAAAVRAFGGLGASAVPVLGGFAAVHGIEQGRGALLALAVAGPPGRIALRELAATHTDAQVRGLARFLLGRPPEGH